MPTVPTVPPTAPLLTIIQTVLCRTVHVNVICHFCRQGPVDPRLAKIFKGAQKTIEKEGQTIAGPAAAAIVLLLYCYCAELSLYYYKI